MREDLKDMKIYRAPTDDILNLGNNENYNGQWNDILAPELTEIIISTSLCKYGPDLQFELLDSYSKYIDVNYQKILCGPGADSLIPLLVNALVDKTMLSLTPDFFRYDNVARVARIKNIKVINDENCYQNIIEECQKNEVELVILSNPNNPLGTTHSRANLVEILDNTNCFVVIDEAYAEFGDCSIVDLLDNYPNLIILRTLSKAFCIAGL